MSNMKRSVRRVFWLLALCFFLLLGYLGKLVIMDGDEISGNAYNHRLRYVDETILYDRQYHVVITLIRDVREHEKLRAQGSELKQQTVEITNKVIDKQMRIVQEIASLLGETTAETQIALNRLKDAMTHE